MLPIKYQRDGQTEYQGSLQGSPGSGIRWRHRSRFQLGQQKCDRYGFDANRARRLRIVCNAAKRINGVELN